MLVTEATWAMGKWGSWDSGTVGPWNNPNSEVRT